MTETIRLIIHGQPATKKNSPQIIPNLGRPVLVPSKTFKKYCREAKAQLRGQILEHRLHLAPITYPIILTCHYHLKNLNHWPDLLGLLEATADILETSGLLANDGLVAHHGDSHICGLDPKHPRVEITITPLPTSHSLYFILHDKLRLGEKGLKKKKNQQKRKKARTVLLRG